MSTSVLRSHSVSCNTPISQYKQCIVILGYQQMKLVHTYFLCQDCEIKCHIQLISKPSLVNSVYYYLFIWQFRALSAQLLVVDWFFFFLSPYLLGIFYTNFFIIRFVWHYILGLTETTWVRACMKKSEGKKKREGGEKDCTILDVRWRPEDEGQNTPVLFPF